MDLSLSNFEIEFRDEVRQFLKDKLTSDLRDAGRKRASYIQEFESCMTWHKILNAQGWVAPSWPVEYGGPGWTAMQWFIFENECARESTPILTPLSLRMLGPMLIGKGSRAQKDRFLPRILSGEEFWCQGYSEPGAGSDLASLQTKAVADGDDYIVNGTKTWTTFAHHANWMFSLVRTSNGVKPQEGISFLLIDMRSPGIEIRPIINIAGEHEFNQVIFTDLRVPRNNLVGTENNGWDVAKYLLEFERFRVASPEARRLLRNVRNFVDHEAAYCSALVAPELSRKFAAAECLIDALEISEMRNVAVLTAGQNPGPEASLIMARQADVIQQVTELGAEASGYYGAVFQPDAVNVGKNAPGIGPDQSRTLMPAYLSYRMRTIGGGTAEIQRNIVAKTVLRL